MLFTDYLFGEVKELGEGTLDKNKFKRYLIQDYLYLKEYAKIYAMAVVKSQSIKEMKFWDMAYEEVK